VSAVSAGPLGPDDDGPAWPDDAVEVGRIVDAWGIQGGIKVQPFSADPQALFSSRRWFLKPPAGPVQAPATVAKPAKAAAVPLPRLLKITQAREQGALVVARAQEVPDRNAAEALKGARIFISRQSFPTAKDGEYYWIDLIGLAVVNRAGEALGEVIDLLDTGAHCVLRVQRPDAPAGAKGDEAERLIPFVDAYVDSVDLAGRRITVDWGLDY
jgi:16S rRNA processing protein RimM